MVLHAFAILASARGLCLARRLYSSWYCMVSYCIALYRMVSYFILWYPIPLHAFGLFGARAVSRKTPIYFIVSYTSENNTYYSKFLCIIQICVGHFPFSSFAATFVYLQLYFKMDKGGYCIRGGLRRSSYTFTESMSTSMSSRDIV